MATVGQLVRALLPKMDDNPDWRSPPLSPVDVFAVTASLLKRSGAYQHVIAAPGVCESGFALKVEADELELVNVAAEQWKAQKEPMDALPAKVIEWWGQLVEAYEAPINTRKPCVPPAWWRAALLLFMSADSASAGIGFVHDTPPASWFGALYDTVVRIGKSQQGKQLTAGPASLSLVSSDLHCVLPKCRTPNVGATLRSLSHHLALLPPEGIAAARWIDRGSDVAKDGPLNLLLVPFPYTIPGRCFQPAMVDHKERWGSFRLVQTWLRAGKEALTCFNHFIDDLVQVGRREVGQIHAVVLPEMALDASYFEHLSRSLEVSTEIEFLVAGVSQTPALASGNYVATTHYFDVSANEDNASAKPVERERVERLRAKHHRWKLDEAQIRRYALSASLDPSFSWWEEFNIEPREVHVVRFRESSTLATLICEDLARVDPCQELIRAIGPSVVMVLLMDGPQLKHRWPARYASVLADDPGSSVLTLTSLGLIRRQRLNGHDCPEIIGLWKDNRTDTREILLPSGYHAGVLSLSPHFERAFTIDGRRRETSVAWRLGGVHPIRVDTPDRYRWILEGTDTV